MEVQEPVIHCFYKDDGEPVWDIIHSSFAAFLKRELEEAVPAPDRHE